MDARTARSGEPRDTAGRTASEPIAPGKLVASGNPVAPGKPAASGNPVTPGKPAAARRTRARGLLVPMTAVGLTVAIGLGTAVALGPATAQSAPISRQETPRQQTPGGSSILDYTWLSDRRVSLTIWSAAMSATIQVQVLVARDWNITPEASFPALYLLDGLRALDTESGWTLDTDAVNFFADKNVNVVLPIGGQSSFYTNWLEPNNGKYYQWETFLIEELPPLLENHWRTTTTRAVAGLSMGGTGAMTLAGRHPGFYRFAGSFSGILATSTPGMPQAITYAQMDAGGFDSAAMWGPFDSPAWKEHDPYELADQLAGTSLYVSSATGAPGPYDQPSEIPGVSNNAAGSGLEALARLSSQTFTTKLGRLGIPVTVSFPPVGTHSWPYWQEELHRAWPQIGDALAVDRERPACEVTGDIATVTTANPWLGDCVTPDYLVGDGAAQDFRNGRVFASAATGAHWGSGLIGGAYQALGGPAGLLGFPLTSEVAAPDGRGLFTQFDHGAIYFTPQTGAFSVHGELLAEWARQGYEAGRLGYPVRNEVATPARPGAVQPFEHGVLYWSRDTGAHRIEGRILDRYAAAGFENGLLGFPLTSEAALRDGGAFNRFEGGNIYWTDPLGAHIVRRGPILDAWESVGFENGRLGYPIGEEVPIIGGARQDFEHGSISVVDGEVTITG